MLIYIFKAIMVNNYLLLLIYTHINKDKDFNNMEKQMKKYIFKDMERKEV